MSPNGIENTPHTSKTTAGSSKKSQSSPRSAPTKLRKPQANIERRADYGSSRSHKEYERQTRDVSDGTQGEHAYELDNFNIAGPTASPQDPNVGDIHPIPRPSIAGTSSPPSQEIPVTTVIITILSLAAVLVFGTGAWIGQKYGNIYARKSYELSLWSTCADHEVGHTTDSHQGAKCLINSYRTYKNIAYATIASAKDQEDSMTVTFNG